MARTTHVRSQHVSKQTAPVRSSTNVRLENLLLILIASALLIGGTFAWKFVGILDGRGHAIQQGVGALGTAVDYLASEVNQVTHRIDSIELLMVQESNEVAAVLAPTQSDEGAKTITYRVRPGDTLWQISESLLGSPHYYRAIAELNQLDPPLIIRPGERLLIPVMGGTASNELGWLK